MGYANTDVPRVLEIGCTPLAATLTISSAAATIGPISFTLPSFVGKCEWAYLDFHLGNIENTFAGWNYFSPEQYIYVCKTGSAWKLATVVYNAHCQLPNGFNGYVGRIYGNRDIASVINEAGSGGSCRWQWTDAQTGNDSFNVFGNIQPILRCCII